jgi:two-component system, cell cycle response regulator
MTRKSQASKSSGFTILLVDDNLDYLETTRRLLEREGHNVLIAANGPDTLVILKDQKVDLVLLDYYMPGMTGEQVLIKLREFNTVVQVILQTGYASEQPPRELLKRLDIQGYYDKSEGPEKLLLWTDVGLKTAYHVQSLTKSRQGLQYILDITPDMHKIQPLRELLQGILLQVTGLLGVMNSFLAIVDGGGIRDAQKKGTGSYLFMLENDTDFVIRASTGSFTDDLKIGDIFDQDKIKAIHEILRRGTIDLFQETTIIPLKVGELAIGIIYFDRQVIQPQDQELMNLFANQAAVAIQNSQLYEMATIDPLTGLFVRTFFEKWLYRELRTAFRSQQPVSLLMVDLDKLKSINDLAGHLAGDRALATVGDILHQATRESDFAGRYGGDEFCVILPQTGEEGALFVGERIVNAFREKTITGSKGDLPLSASIGLSTLEPHTFTLSEIPHPIPLSYFETTIFDLIRNADDALYLSKKNGGNQLQSSAPIRWRPFTS